MTLTKGSAIIVSIEQQTKAQRANKQMQDPNTFSLPLFLMTVNAIRGMKGAKSEVITALAATYGVPLNGAKTNWHKLNRIEAAVSLRVELGNNPFGASK